MLGILADYGKSNVLNDSNNVNKISSTIVSLEEYPTDNDIALPSAASDNVSENALSQVAFVASKTCNKTLNISEACLALFSGAQFHGPVTSNINLK
jgi:hypothetical protein